MNEFVFENQEDVISKMNTGNKEQDLSVINAVLSGSVQIGNKQETTVEEQKITEPKTEENKEESISVSPQINYETEELERQKKYFEMLERRRQEEKEQLLREKQEKEEEVNRERKIREDLEQRIREIEVRRQNDPSSSQQEEESEEEYTSDYNKKTRMMVESLKKDVSTNPEFNQVFERIEKIESTFKQEADERNKFLELKKKEEASEKVYGSIRQFMLQHPELKTDKDIKDIDSEYQKFRKDIAFITNARSNDELDNYIKEYKNNGKTKEIADQNGIKINFDIDKYDSIADLIDYKNGFYYDPILGKRIEKLDENGVRVRYGSLEEAYNIKNYYDQLSNAKRQAYKEVNQKLTQIGNAPVTLRNEVTESLSTGISSEQEREILNMDPKKWMGDPDKYKLVERVYAKHGLEMPKYRGRRF